MRRQYPWYDSIWLGQYAGAKQRLAEASPSKLPEFLGAMEHLRTRPDFQIQRLSHVVGGDVMHQVKQACRSLTPTAMELHEMRRFGRWVVHGNAFFTDLQRSLTGLASEIAGESLECVFRPTWALVPPAPGRSVRRTWAGSERSDGVSRRSEATSG
jgi:hypothetical protein